MLGFVMLQYINVLCQTVKTGRIRARGKNNSERREIEGRVVKKQEDNDCNPFGHQPLAKGKYVMPAYTIRADMLTVTPNKC